VNAQRSTHALISLRQRYRLHLREQRRQRSQPVVFLSCLIYYCAVLIFVATPQVGDSVRGDLTHLSNSYAIDVGVNDGVGAGCHGVENTEVGDSSLSASERRATDAGAGSAGASEDNDTDRKDSGGTGKGDPAFVVPASACSALHAVAPTFRNGMGWLLRDKCDII